jgi:uncharacterized protein YndB with AHSA1/START domain
VTVVVAPVHKVLSLACSPERAFEVFTSEMATWWPLDTHGAFKAGAASLVFETHDGGRIIETSKDGTENIWAVVSVWDPPKRVVFSWTPDLDKSVQTEVEVRCAADGDGTRFELIHRGWERWGDQADAYRSGYDNGWTGVLASFEATVA